MADKRPCWRREGKAGVGETLAARIGKHGVFSNFERSFVGLKSKVEEGEGHSGLLACEGTIGRRGLPEWPGV